MRPELAGFSREASELHKLHTTITHLLRTMARNFSIQLPLGPLYPHEVLQVEKAREELADLDDDIASSMRKPLVLQPKKKRKEANANT